jgi:hypothetical protein
MLIIINCHNNISLTNPINMLKFSLLTHTDEQNLYFGKYFCGKCTSVLSAISGSLAQSEPRNISSKNGSLSLCLRRMANVRFSWIYIFALVMISKNDLKLQF